MDSGAAPDRLEKLLEPHAREEFLASSWGRACKHVPGRAGKFAELLPWPHLNEILRRHRLDFPRLRLMRDGRAVPASDYLRHTTNARRQVIPRLKPANLTRHLREGATLVLDAVDELHAPLEELAEELEFFFRERVQINAYAGWRTARGFDLHWDDHDVFILQAAGRKRWRVYGQTKPHPLTQDEANPKPTGEPVWEDTLEDGDLLYIPRGWWHVALPLDEPTLHLTVGVHNRTGVDLLRWLTEQMRESELFRTDLPRFADASGQKPHMEQLRRELFARWDEQLLERYLNDYDANAEPRARLSLPWGATPNVLPASDRALVRWAVPRPVELKAEGGVVELCAHKRRWRFDEKALAVLGPLSARRVCSVAELCEGARATLDERTVRAFLRELIVQGLVVIVKE